MKETNEKQNQGLVLLVLLHRYHETNLFLLGRSMIRIPFSMLDLFGFSMCFHSCEACLQHEPVPNFRYHKERSSSVEHEIVLVRSTFAYWPNGVILAKRYLDFAHFYKLSNSIPLLKVSSYSL